MRMAFKQIGALALALLAFCLLCRLTVSRDYTAYIPLSEAREEALRSGELRLEVDVPGVLIPGQPEIRDGYLRLPLLPGAPGDAFVSVYAGGESSGSGEDPELLRAVRVGRFHTVYDRQTGGFTGDRPVMVAVTLFWLLVGAIMIWHFLRARGPAFYAYATIYYAGFSLFSLSTGLVLLRITLAHLLRPQTYPMNYIYSALSGASTWFMMLTAPLLPLFALAMAVSNLALLRHERPRPQNFLGLLISLLILLGEALGWYLFTRNFMGSEWEARLRNTLENTYATVFVYFECMLAGSVLCGLLSARRKPAFGKDFILILGCWFRPDGSLPPLLRGRADRALAFWREQKEKTGRAAFFIPTGGQGRDEPFPEGEALRRYLVSRGVPDSLILPETRAVSTLENMSFSREIIRARNPEGKALFATTSYHVFRSGVWALQAGLLAEGIGSPTKWWFWPNAFMRETVGLLQKRWKQELLFLLLLIAFFALLSMAVI